MGLTPAAEAAMKKAQEEAAAKREAEEKANKPPDKAVNYTYSEGLALNAFVDLWVNAKAKYIEIHKTKEVADKWATLEHPVYGALRGDIAMYEADVEDYPGYFAMETMLGKDEPFEELGSWMSYLEQTINPLFSEDGLKKETDNLIQTLQGSGAAADVTAWINDNFSKTPLDQLEAYITANGLTGAFGGDAIILAYHTAWVKVTGGGNPLPSGFMPYQPGWGSKYTDGTKNSEAAAAFTEQLNDMFTIVTVAYGVGLANLARQDEVIDAMAAKDEGVLQTLDMLNTYVGAQEAELPGIREAQERAAKSAMEAVIGRAEVRFQEQCFLLSQVYNLAGEKRSKERIASSTDISAANTPWLKPLPYYGASGNASVLASGNPYGFINRLTQHPHQNKFFDMTTAEISSLQPMIRLFKVFENEEDQQEYQHEFNFDSHASAADVESLTESRDKRGFGVGIQNFSFTYDGNNPFAAKKSIKAQVTIFASSFDELLKERAVSYLTNETPPKSRSRTYRYADLALKTWMGKHAYAKEENVVDIPECRLSVPIEDDANSKLNFRLKAIVGYARPLDSTWFNNKSQAERTQLLDAIGQSYVTLNLTPTTHDFKIDDMGRVTFNINYLAYVEDFYDQPQFDIFYDEEVAMRIMGRKYEYEALSELCKADEIATWKEGLATSGVIRKDKFENMQSLMSRLQAKKKIRYINMTFAEIVSFNAKGPFFQKEGSVEITDSPSNEGALQSALLDEYTQAWDQGDEGGKADEDLGNVLANTLQATNPTQENLGFFYVSDLVDVILEGIEARLKTFSQPEIYDQAPLDTIEGDAKSEEIQSHRQFYEQYKKFRVVLGPVEIMNPINNSSMSTVNFGDVPISTKYFLEWLSEEMLKREQTQYNLSKFLNDLLNTLVRNFLNNDSCFAAFSTKQKVRVTQAAITSYKDDPRYKWDEITKFIVSHKWNSVLNISDANVPTPLLNVSGPLNAPGGDAGIQNEMNYMVYFAGRTQPLELMQGNREQDVAAGIFHYMIGRPKGIIKTISLTKTDAKYLKEVRFQQEGFDGLQQLREVYDVNIDCYANPKTFPGTYIFVDPRGFAPNTLAYDSDNVKFDLTRYGIGGYCMIIRSEHNFGPGKAETKVTAKWVAEIAGEEENKECEDAKAKNRDTGDNSKSKCPAYVTETAQEEKSGAEALGEKITSALDSVGTTLDSWTGGL